MHNGAWRSWLVSWHLNVKYIVSCPAYLWTVIAHTSHVPFKYNANTPCTVILCTCHTIPYILHYPIPRNDFAIQSQRTKTCPYLFQRICKSVPWCKDAIMPGRTCLVLMLVVCMMTGSAPSDIHNAWLRVTISADAKSTDRNGQRTSRRVEGGNRLVHGGRGSGSGRAHAKLVMECRLESLITNPSQTNCFYYGL